MEATGNIYLIGAAAVIVSGVKLEDWKRVELYAPDALEIRDENGETVFRVMTSGGPGSICENLVTWGNYPTDEGLATITLLLDEDVEDKLAAVMDVAGSALEKVENIEKAIPGILEEIDARGEDFETQLIRLLQATDE